MKFLVEKGQPDVTIIDGREADFFTGVRKHEKAKEGGRIRGAINAPVREMLNTQSGDFGLKILPELVTWMTSKGFNAKGPNVVYSNNGLHASLLYFVMVQAGWESTMYTNGWVEWSYKAPENLKQRS